MRRLGARSAALTMVLVLVAAACSDSSSTAPPTAPSLPGDEDYNPSLSADDLADENPETASVVDQYSWQTLSSGAGGFVTGMDVDPAGETLVARTDVGGAYRWDRDAETWTQLLDIDGVDDPQRRDYFVESAVVAPSDPSRLYLAVGDSDSTPNGRLLRSDDGGDTWTAGAGELVISGNGSYRNGAERLAVDPDDPDELWFASRTQGLLVSRDGGATLAPVDGIPVTSGPDGQFVGTSFVAAADDGVTLWAGVANVGIFGSTDDGATWALISETVGIPADADIDAQGRLWVVEDEPAAIKIIEPSGSVDELDELSGSLRVIGLDPADPDTAFVGGPGIANGSLWRTTDGGSNWSSLELTTSCESVPWLDAYPNEYFPSGSLLFDPVDGALWVPEGFGIWRDGDPADGIDLECRVAGVEELVSNDVVVPRGGRPVTASWDRALFYHGGITPDEAIQGPTTRFNSAWSLDVSPSDPSMVYAVVADHRFCCEGDGNAYASGWSDDGGRTWTRFGSYDDGHPADLRFGNIAVSATDPDNLVWLPTFNKAPHVTFDRGETWTEIILPGTETLLDEDGNYAGGSHFTYFLNRSVLVADRVEPATFYLYHSDLGMFRSTDGGTTWEAQASEGLPVGWTVGYFHAKVLASPTTAGHLLFAPGFLAEEVTGLYESFDAGATWTRREGMADVGAFDWGAPASDTDAATLYVAGTLGGERGLWRAVDGSATWDLISAAPNGNYQGIKAIGADPEEYGTVYIGFEGTSFVVGTLGEG